MEKFDPKFLGKFSIVVEAYPGKSSRNTTCKSCLEGMSPKMDWSKLPKKVCLLRFVPRLGPFDDLIDKASADKFETLKILKEIAPVLKHGEVERAEREIINFFY